MTNEEQKSDRPQLIQIAATILTGLLASGEYTEGRMMDEGGGYPRTTISVRPGAVRAAIDLARQLIAECEAEAQPPMPPADAS